jgi:superfamily II DNA or RNA helicase
VHLSFAEAKNELAESLAAVPLTEPRVILPAGSYLGEEFDDPRLDTLLLVMPISWKGTLQQYVGRLHRVHQYKTEVQVYDYVDVSVPVLARMYKRRLAGATPRSGTPSQRLIEAKGRLVKTLQKIPAGVEVIPATTSWYLADLGEARGKTVSTNPQGTARTRSHRKRQLSTAASVGPEIFPVDLSRGSILRRKHP